MASATFGAGCFWGVEAAFRRLEGVTATRVGYAGGKTESPTYDDVCSGATGHAEVVEVTFEPGTVSYEDLLELFWDCHDPTQLDRQGPDVGTQYRSAIFVHGGEQAAAAVASRDRAAERHDRPIATRIEPAPGFWPAEEYHQQYLAKRGQDACASTIGRTPPAAASDT